jgi:peroxiredoxin
MKKTLGLLFTCVLWLAAPAQAAPIIGQPAPAFTATDTKGQPVSLASLKGKTVVLEWSNHECPFVKKFYGAGKMQELQRQAAVDGVVWVTVISSAPGKQGNVSAKDADELTTSRQAAPAHVILDESGNIGRLYAAKTTPHMFVIDGQGVLRYQGGIDDKPSTKPEDIASANNYVTAALADLKAGRAVAQANTKPYGCSVKYGE